MFHHIYRHVRVLHADIVHFKQTLTQNFGCCLDGGTKVTVLQTDISFCERSWLLVRWLFLFET